MSTITVKRFLGYRRVSTGEQSTLGTSLDGQKEELAALAAKLGAATVLDFVEVESAGSEKQERRVEVARLLDSVRSGDVVVVTKFDRFTRDLGFAISKVREVLGKGARFVSIAEGEFDRSPEGELKLSIWASIAQMERARIRDRTHGQKTRLRLQGKFMDGLPPFGYVRAPSVGYDKPRRLDVDPEHAHIIVLMFEMCIRGCGTKTIARHLRANHTGRRFTDQWVLSALRNRVYAGQLATTPTRSRARTPTPRLPPQWVDAHEPIISLEMFHLAQAALDSRYNHGGKPRGLSNVTEFLMRGLGTCGICNTVIRSVPAYTPERRHGRYVCRHRTHPRPGKPRCNSAPYVRREVLDASLEQQTVARLIALRELLALSPEPAREAPDFHAKRADISARRKRLVQAVASGKLGLDDIDAPIAALDAELADVDAAAAACSARSAADTPEARRAALAFVGVVSEAWAGLTVDERRNVVAVLAERIVLTVDGVLAITWRDASGFAASIAAIRPELADKLSTIQGSAPSNDRAPASSDARTQTSADKRSSRPAA